MGDDAGNYDALIRSSISLMEEAAVIFDQGLSDLEIADVEYQFGIRFPPDLRAFLRVALPVGFDGPADNLPPFHNWRCSNDPRLAFYLDLPFEGLAFDIEQNSFWVDSWGERPRVLSEALSIARAQYLAAPKLIPVYGHRYLPEDPCEAGNPVFSVHQMDIIYFGQNLWDYFEQEFGRHEPDWYVGKRYADWTAEQYHAAHRRIRFWSDHVG